QTVEVDIPVAVGTPLERSIQRQVLVAIDVRKLLQPQRHREGIGDTIAIDVGGQLGPSTRTGLVRTPRLVGEGYRQKRADRVVEKLMRGERRHFAAASPDLVSVGAGDS